jgi:hypothetical protein
MLIAETGLLAAIQQIWQLAQRAADFRQERRFTA